MEKIILRRLELLLNNKWTKEEIMKLIESVKYYSPFQKYVITEEGFEEAIKSL